MSPAAVRTAPPPARGDRLELGDRVRLRGHVWRVVSWQGESISLAPADRNDTELTALFAALVGAEDFAVLDRADRPLTRTELSSRTGQFDALPVEVRADALRWQRHVMEVLHQQAPNVPATGVPHPAYDPATHTLQERYRAKAAQLSALGWDVSHHTVERKCRAWRRSGPMGLVDRRRTRPPSPCGRTDPRVVDVLWQVLDAEAGKSAGTVTRLWGTRPGAGRTPLPSGDARPKGASASDGATRDLLQTPPPPGRHRRGRGRVDRAAQRRPGAAPTPVHTHRGAGAG
ncbi:hypothetical protein [Embleya sp. MST-111070]|uniref:hypothetical protein n=1 Tax=Embleya sp. MST-111070 TaxID=3398231 RepID=UPI003F73820E